MTTETVTAEAGASIAEIKLQAEKSAGALQVIDQKQELSPEDQARITGLASSISMDDTNSIIVFGTDAQKGLTAKSESIMEGVRNKDTGPAGEVMNDIMVQIRGLGVDNLNPNAKQGFIGRILGWLTPVQKFMQSYETIGSQLDAMIQKLESEKRTLSRDVIMLDAMYDEAIEFFHELGHYIAAGELKLEEVNEQVLPAMLKEAQEATGDDAMLLTQKYKDMEAARDDLERRVHDLRLTRQVTMQTLPQLRLIQDVDKGLVTKIQSTILTTIPTWKNQIAIAITLWRQQQAIKTTKAVTDGTNELMKKNAAALKTQNAAARKEMERGVIDMDTIKQVNADLIATIEESIAIAQEGKRARIESQQELLEAEGQLKQALLSANTSSVVNAE